MYKMFNLLIDTKNKANNTLIFKFLTEPKTEIKTSIMALPIRQNINMVGKRTWLNQTLDKK